MFICTWNMFQQHHHGEKHEQSENLSEEKTKEEKK